LRPGAEATACDEAWGRVRVAVEQAGGRAWRFHETVDPALLVEFIEWSEPSDPLGRPAVNHARSILDAMTEPVSEQLLEEH